MDRIIRVIAALDGTCGVVVNVPAGKALGAQTGGHFSFRAVNVLLTQHAGHRLHQHKRFYDSAWYPAANRAVYAMIIEASRMHIEACWIYIHNRRTEQVHAVFVSDAGVEPIEAATRLCPVTNTNHTLISKTQQLSSSEELERFMVESYISLSKVEIVTHVGGDVFGRKSQGVKVVELDIA